MRCSLPLVPGFSLLAMVILGFMGVPSQAREVQIAPAWSVKVVDVAGKPVEGLKVEESWEFFGLSPSHRGSDSRMTNASGVVVFPERSFRVLSLSYIVGRGVSALNVHASFGPSCKVRIAPPGGYKQADAWYADNDKVYDHNGATTSKDNAGFTTVFQFQALDVFDFLDAQDWATVKRMLAADAAIVNVRNSAGQTPLIYLSMFGFSGPKAEMIKLLLAAGADINAQAKDGTTALHRAAQTYSVPYMELLLSKGADPKAKIHDSIYYTTNGFTPLHFLLGAYANGGASAYAAQKIVGIKCLLAKGADINAKDAEGETPLHLAAVWSDPEIVTALLAAGADPQAKNLQGQTPLTSIKSLNDTEPVHKTRALLSEAEAQKKDASRPLVP